MTNYNKNDIIQRMNYLIGVIESELRCGITVGLDHVIAELRELISKLRSC
jgi:hypothetical protein